MGKGSKKTKKFKVEQCRKCSLADKAKLRKRLPCCPLPNPRIKTGQCLDKPKE